MAVLEIYFNRGDKIHYLSYVILKNFTIAFNTNVMYIIAVQQWIKLSLHS